MTLGNATSELRQVVDRAYSYRDLRHVDWDASFAEYSQRMKAAASAADFSIAASQLLARAGDIHISVSDGTRVLQPFHGSAVPNYALDLISKTVTDVHSDHHCVSWGHAAPGVGYILVGAWTAPCASSAQQALDALLTQTAIIIDVRPNTGGDDALASEFAGRLITAPIAYGFVERLVDGHFEPRQPRMLQPNRTAAHFRGKIIALMGPRCMSSNESFLLMMRAARAVLIGAKSFGSSGNPKPHRLSNGVIVNLPSWREYQADGTLLEGSGISPDINIEWPTNPMDDVVLTAAVTRLSRH